MAKGEAGHSSIQIMNLEGTPRGAFWVDVVKYCVSHKLSIKLFHMLKTSTDKFFIKGYYKNPGFQYTHKKDNSRPLSWRKVIPKVNSSKSEISGFFFQLKKKKLDSITTSWQYRNRFFFLFNYLDLFSPQLVQPTRNRPPPLRIRRPAKQVTATTNTEEITTQFSGLEARETADLGKKPLTNSNTKCQWQC